MGQESDWEILEEQASKNTKKIRRIKKPFLYLHPPWAATNSRGGKADSKKGLHLLEEWQSGRLRQS